MIIKELISSICSWLLASGPLCPWEAHRGNLWCVLSLAVICDPMDYSLSGCSLHGILQARVLEWVAIHFSLDLPNPGIEPFICLCHNHCPLMANICGEI